MRNLQIKGNYEREINFINKNAKNVEGKKVQEIILRLNWMKPNRKDEREGQKAKFNYEN